MAIVIRSQGTPPYGISGISPGSTRTLAPLALRLKAGLIGTSSLHLLRLTTGPEMAFSRNGFTHLLCFGSCPGICPVRGLPGQRSPLPGELRHCSFCRSSLWRASGSRRNSELRDPATRPLCGYRPCCRSRLVREGPLARRSVLYLLPVQEALRAWHTAATCHVGLREWDAAITAAQRALRISPDSSPAREILEQALTG